MKKIDRRDFLKTIAQSAAAVGTASVIAGCAGVNSQSFDATPQGKISNGAGGRQDGCSACWLYWRGSAGNWPC